MPSLLDPKLDVVFKMLFADERNRRLLESLLTAVLEPPEAIASLEILNPELPREEVVQKGAILDVRARLKDGTQIQVEMQSLGHPGFRQRALFYWARLYTSQLVRGDAYVELAPAVSVFFLNFVELPTQHYHSTFSLVESREGAKLTEDLAIHVLELKKLPPGPAAAEAPAVLLWSKFLAARSEEELEQLAMSDPNLREAKNALERLSADPKARELATERELWAWNHERGLRLARLEGKREAVFMVLETRGLGVAPQERERIARCRSDAQLDHWLRRASTATTTAEVLQD